MGIKTVVALLLITFIICVHSECPNPYFREKHVSGGVPSEKTAREKAKKANKLRTNIPPSEIHDVFFLIEPARTENRFRMNGEHCEMQQPCAVHYRCTWQVQRNYQGRWNCEEWKKHGSSSIRCPQHLPNGHYTPL